MKVSRRLVVSLILSAGFVLVSEACGPFFPEAIFVQQTRPDGSYADYVKGRVGVPQPGYRMRHMVVAYDWLNGHGLSAGEQQQALSLEAMLNPPPDRQSEPVSEVTAGVAAWLAELDRVKAGGSGAGPAQPGAAQTGASGASESGTNESAEKPNAAGMFQTERSVPGEDYQSFPNCLADAFTTAAKTLGGRKAAHPGETAALADWVGGQEAVFANCGGEHDTMPVDAPAGAPLWLRQDRAYQRAAASFYQMNYDAAIAQMRGIAADAASPWRQTARFVVARAMIRKATVGQSTEVPAGAGAPRNAPYSKERGDLLAGYQKAVEAKRPARLAEARKELQAIVADPAMANFHGSAAGLVDLVALKLDPTAQARVLERRLTAANRTNGPQGPGGFRQALIDISYFRRGEEPEPATSEASAELGLLAWVRTMAGAEKDGDRESLFVTNQEVAGEKARRAQAAQDAVAGWRSARTTPWLIAALTAVAPGDAAVPELLRATRELPQGSPASVAATYYRLRLETDQPAARAELDQVLPGYAESQTRSTINLFVGLRQRSSPTPAAFLHDAGTLPAGTTSFDGDDPAALGTKPVDGLCHLQASEAETRLFDHEAATVLNTRMPLGMLAEAAGSEVLPVNIRFQIAQATWTRAVLLNRPEVAKRMTPLLSGCYPAWQPWLGKYDGAANAEDREANGLLALMRFASTEPIVRDGAQRSEGFASYSEYRDNWWQESKAGGPPVNGDGTVSKDGTVLATFFGTVPALPAELPDPPFLSAEDRAGAGREVAALRTIPCASDYFAKAALAWQEKHPGDSRTADILGFAERVVRSGCRTDATKELNHRLFVVVQGRYPKSEWARKYTTWE